jgi:outer membrane protein assembly factor BamD
MKKFLLLIFSSLLLWGCSSSVNTSNYTAQQRLDYALKLYHDESYLDAVQEFQAIVLQYPGNSVVDDAQYYLAETRYERHEYILAAYEFSKLIKSMPASEFVPNSQYMLAQCYFELSPDYRLDQQYTKKAISEFQAFIDFFPTSDKVKDAEQKIVELNDKLAHKEFNTAQLYETMDFNKAALMYYTNVVEDYHDTKYAAMAQYNKIKLLIDQDKNSDALEEIATFLDRYPDDQNVKEIEKLKTELQSNLSSKN